MCFKLTGITVEIASGGISIRTKGLQPSRRSSRRSWTESESLLSWQRFSFDAFLTLLFSSPDRSDSGLINAAVGGAKKMQKRVLGTVVL